MKRALLTVCIFLLFVVTQSAFGQRIETIRLGVPLMLSLSGGESRAYNVGQTKGDYGELSWLASEDLDLRFQVIAPSGVDLLNDLEPADSIPMVFPETGDYRITVKLGEKGLSTDHEITGAHKITFEYSTKFKLPRARILAQKVINGITIKLLATETPTILMERAGRPVYIRRDQSFTRLFFSDDLREAYTPFERRSSALLKKIRDISGDGLPDVAVENFSGGAHCCYDFYLFELTEMPTLRIRVPTAHSRLSAVRALTDGTRFEMADWSYAYWNISFAGSPSPIVVVDFLKGELRPNFSEMKRTAPSLSILKAKATKARAKMSLMPYTGYLFAGMSDDLQFSFEEAFWSEMLNLIYTGNEPLAWQYFDLVWPVGKAGKELFVSDFKKALADSSYTPTHQSVNEPK